MPKKNKTYIISEIGQAHDGSLGTIHSYIDALKDTGVDAIKFQMHFAKYESSIYEKFRINFSYQDKTRYDYWKRIEFSEDQWKEIKQHCDDVGLDFICSTFSSYSLDLLMKVGFTYLKVPSGELSNFLLLDQISKTNKRVILSTGLSNHKEISEAVDIFGSNKKNLSILHCTSEYPTSPANLGLENIDILKNKFNLPIGFSDHSGKIYSSLMAINLGAEIIEAHAIFDKRMFGPDTSSSLTIENFKSLVEGARFIEKAKRKNSREKLSNKSIKTKKIFGRSLIVNKNLPKGSIISQKDLDSLKPAGFGLSPKYFQKLIDKKLLIKKNKNDFILLKDVK